MLLSSVKTCTVCSNTLNLSFGTSDHLQMNKQKTGCVFGWNAASWRHTFLQGGIRAWIEARPVWRGRMRSSAAEPPNTR